MEIELWYFSSKDCGVCKVLKPKIVTLLEEKFAGVQFIYVDIEEEMEKAAQYGIFTIPVVLIIIDGKEYHRFVRTFSVLELENKLARLVEIANS